MQGHWSHTVCVLCLQHASVFPPYPEQWKHSTELTRLFSVTSCDAQTQALCRSLPVGGGEQADGRARWCPCRRTRSAGQSAPVGPWALAVRRGALASWGGGTRPARGFPSSP